MFGVSKSTDKNSNSVCIFEKMYKMAITKRVAEL